MKQYVERMIQEQEDLIGKIKKAVKVIETKPFNIDKTQLMLLGQQVKIMRDYHDVLNERIKYETEKEGK